ncbi:DUF6063 family protein [Geobacillus sp. YF-1]|uniref:DUF6063 family protein n=1 Tax=Geobacillus sp. YF-1 TaxID=3457480 RepID=UPI0040461A21
MRNYPEQKVMQAFQLYTALARQGVAGAQAVQLYKSDDEIRALLDAFSREVDCVIVLTSERLFLVPRTKLSPFHVSNDWIKRHYLRAGATNGDLYLLYFAVLVLFGSFYDTYQSPEPTRNFLAMDEWVRLVQERIDQLKRHDPDELKQFEQEFSYNWSLIIEKWEAMDDVKETAKRQSGATISRLSFLDVARRFLIDQELVVDIGNDEVALTEKAKTIIQRFFMEVEYNRGIFEFIYGFERERDDASDQ